MNQIIIQQEEYDSKRGIAKSSSPLVLAHISTILKLKPGDSCKLIILNESLAQAEIVNIDSKNVEFKILKMFDGEEPWINLYIGLSRPPTCKKILEHATTLGARSFTFFTTKLSEKSYSTSKLWQDGAYLEFLYAGLSQSKKYFQIPRVELKKSIRDLDFPRDNLFLLSLESKDWFNKDKIKRNQINVAVGSERGWTEDEEIFFETKGFKKIKISDSTMRVEHATIAVMSQLEFLLKSN